MVYTHFQTRQAYVRLERGPLYDNLALPEDTSFDNSEASA